MQVSSQLWEAVLQSTKISETAVVLAFCIDVGFFAYHGDNSVQNQLEPLKLLMESTILWVLVASSGAMR